MAIDLDDYDCSAGRPVAPKKSAGGKGTPNNNKGGGKGGGKKGGGKNSKGGGSKGGGGKGNNSGGGGGGGGGGGKGGKRPKGPAEGGSVLKQQFRQQMQQSTKNNLRKDHHLGEVAVSQENKGLVLDVLKNIRDDVDEEVKGLDTVSRPMKPIQKIELIDGQTAREISVLFRRGIPKPISQAIVKEMRDENTETRLWTAVLRAMEEIAEEYGGALTDGAEWEEEDLEAARQEERDGLDTILEEGMLQEMGGGAVEVSLAIPLDPHHQQYAQDMRLVVRGLTDGKYPSTAPLALLMCTADLENIPFTRDVNKHIWMKITTELIGQPVLYSLISDLEVVIPELLAKHYPKPAPEPKAGKGGRKGGKKGAKGAPPPAHPEQKHSQLVADILKEQGGEAGGAGKKVKVPQLFPELSQFEVKVQGPAAARSGDREWPGIEKNTDADARLQERYERRIRNKEGLPEQRAKLPAAKLEDRLLETIRENQVTLVTGETGCGKTTQVPQFVLDAMLREGRGSECRIVCTQPRRIAATSIARRVASERGDSIGNQIGYSIRLESKQSAETRLLFCTTGVLLRKIQGSGSLDYVSHIVVDEVHERSLDSDFLLIFLKDLIQKRSDLKVILMSASVNADLFSDYFDKCPVIHIPGFTHPVTIVHAEEVINLTNYTLEDDSPCCLRGKGGRDLDEFSSRSDANQALKQGRTRDSQAEYISKAFPGVTRKTMGVLERMNEDLVNNELIIELLHQICFGKYRDEDGAVLVFLPGMQEINTLFEDINSDRKLCGAVESHRLHSTVSNQEQEGVFNKVRNKSKRKVVLSTNIAETSVTIDDIVFVVDTGKHKENRYAAQQGMNKLVSRWISQANARQRKGRAGRVRPGYCFRTYTSFVHDVTMQKFQECEMTRVPLQNLLLQIRVLNFGDASDTEVLQRAIEAPRDSSVKACRDSLQGIGAIGPSNNLTSLGLHLANLPLDPKLGKLLLHGLMLRCIDPCLTIAATLQSKSPFVTPYERKTEADLAKAQASKKSRSDHLASLNAYNAWLVMKDDAGAGWRQKEREHAHKRFISAAAMTQIQQTKRQYWTLLQDMGLIDNKLFPGTGTTWRTVGSEGEPWMFEFGGKELNQHSAMRQAVKASLVAAFTPNVVRVKYSRNKANPRPFLNEQNGDVSIHPSSVCGNENQYPHPLLVYYEKVQTTKVYLRDVTMVTPQMLMLFAVDVEYQDGIVLINKWISFHMDSEMLAVIAELRKEMQKLLAGMVKSSGTEAAGKTKHFNVIAAVMKLLKDERIGGKDTPDGV